MRLRLELEHEPLRLLLGAAGKQKHLAMLQSFHRNRTILIFTSSCTWIAAVSVHDAVLVVVHQEVISQFERNPLGRWLLQLHGGEVWLFVAVKLAGTAVVCKVLFRLYQYRSGIALLVAVVLSCFQMLLLFHLHCR